MGTLQPLSWTVRRDKVVLKNTSATGGAVYWKLWARFDK